MVLWTAFPPLGWWPVAWLAPAVWVVLARMEKLPGRRPYRAIWAAGLIHWLVLLAWVRLAHWSAWFGWWALCLYLSIYLPLFIALTRIAVRRLGISVVLAAPIAWTGLELARGYILTGFSIGLLGHTQGHWTRLIQLSDATGAYGVSFLVMLFAAGLARTIPLDSAERRWSVWPLASAAAAVSAALLYGEYRLRQPATADAGPVHVALIQGSIDVEFGKDQRRESVEQYRDLSLKACREHTDLDLIVWPESMFAYWAPHVTYDAQAPTDPEYKEQLDQGVRLFENAVLDLHTQHRAVLQQKLGRDVEVPAFVVCTETVHFEPKKIHRYNTAVLINSQGVMTGYYNKMHPVMFGEYVPWGDWFPWVYRLTPLGSGLTPGESPAVFPVGGVRFSPSICFESTVPHLIRSQVADLAQRRQSADVLVNLTNDGWFRGSAGLDMHLVCSLFRAVETRKPVLIAANTGFSAWIDSAGRVLRQGPRRRTGIMVVDVRADGRTSPYVRWGDLAAGVCLLFCVVALVAEGLGRWSRS